MVVTPSGGGGVPFPEHGLRSKLETAVGKKRKRKEKGKKTTRKEEEKTKTKTKAKETKDRHKTDFFFSFHL